MIDLILFCTIGAAFFFGFKAGAKFNTFTKFGEAVKAKLKSA